MPKLPITERTEGAGILFKILEGKNSTKELAEVDDFKQYRESKIRQKKNPYAAPAMKIRPLIEEKIIRREGITNGSKYYVDWAGWSARIIAQTHDLVTEPAGKVLHYRAGRFLSAWTRSVRDPRVAEGLAPLLERYVRNLFEDRTAEYTIAGIEREFIRFVGFMAFNENESFFTELNDSGRAAVYGFLLAFYREVEGSGPYSIQKQGVVFDGKDVLYLNR